MEPAAPADTKLLSTWTAGAKFAVSAVGALHGRVPQATQRAITVETSRWSPPCVGRAVLQRASDSVPEGKRKKLRKVVPDNFVIVHPEPIEALTSFGTQV